MIRQLMLFPSKIVSPKILAEFLDQNHYLGPAVRGFGWIDEFGVMVLASPTARHLPNHWLELTRWCLVGGIQNGGTRQWSKVRRWLLDNHSTTTIVSYSDPSVGHTGSLYRACGWLWAPTWHRIVTPPTGHGAWSKTGVRQNVKDRWVFPLRPEKSRADVLKLDPTYLRRFPWAEYTDPVRWVRGRGIGGGADWRDQT